MMTNAKTKHTKKNKYAREALLKYNNESQFNWLTTAKIMITLNEILHRETQSNQWILMVINIYSANRTQMDPQLYYRLFITVKGKTFLLFRLFVLFCFVFHLNCFGCCHSLYCVIHMIQRMNCDCSTHGHLLQLTTLNFSFQFKLKICAEC